MNRRDFIRASTAGLAAATIPAAGSGRAADNIVSEGQLGSLRSASPSDLQGLVGDGRQRRILLRGGVVLSLDPRVGDFEKADVLIDGKRIAEVAPTVSAGDASDHGTRRPVESGSREDRHPIRHLRGAVSAALAHAMPIRTRRTISSRRSRMTLRTFRAGGGCLSSFRAPRRRPHTDDLRLTPRCAAVRLPAAKELKYRCLSAVHAGNARLPTSLARQARPAACRGQAPWRS
jgi:hypothetical protein